MSICLCAYMCMYTHKYTRVSLLREVFLRVLQFSPLLKNQHYQIPIRSGLLLSNLSCRSLWLNRVIVQAPSVFDIKFTFTFTSHVQETFSVISQLLFLQIVQPLDDLFRHIFATLFLSINLQVASKVLTYRTYVKCFFFSRAISQIPIKLTLMDYNHSLKPLKVFNLL